MSKSIQALNIQNLQETNRQLAAQILGFDPPKTLSIKDTRSGNPTVQVQLSTTQKYWYSRVDPIREVTTFLEAQELTGYDRVIVFGFGLGYLVEKLLETRPDLSEILVIEPDYQSLALAFKARDLTALLTTNRVHFLVHADRGDLLHDLDRFSALSHTKTKLIVQPALMAHWPDGFSDRVEQVKHHIFTKALGVASTMSPAHTFQMENFFKLLPKIETIGDVGSLFGAFQNQPIICVSAGPSLADHMKTLKSASGWLIIACDSAVPPLMAAGLTPHIITSSDPFPQNNRHFKGWEDKLKSIPLVVDATANQDVVAGYPGPKLTYDSGSPMTRWLAAIYPTLGQLKQGRSVGNLSLNLAIKLGGSPILMVGQDLCFGPEFTPQTKPNGERFVVRGDQDRGQFEVGVFEVKNTAGQSVWTHAEWETVKTALELKIQETAAVVWQIGGGLGIKGAQQVTAEQVLAHPTHPGIEQGLKTAIKKSVYPDRSKRDQEIVGLRQQMDVLVAKVNQAQTDIEDCQSIGCMACLTLTPTEQDHLESLRQQILAHRGGLLSLIEWAVPRQIHQLKQANVEQILNTPVEVLQTSDRLEKFTALNTTLLEGCTQLNSLIN